MMDQRWRLISAWRQIISLWAVGLMDFRSAFLNNRRRDCSRAIGQRAGSTVFEGF